MKEIIAGRYPEHTWELVSERSIRSIYRLMKDGRAEYYVKIYSPESLMERVRNLLSPRTRREARMLGHLKLSGIPAPEVVCHLRSGSSSTLITRAIHPARTLHTAERSVQVSAMLEICVRLINSGFHYTDMHAGNIVLDKENNAFLVDAYEVERCKGITLEKAADLLAQAVNIYEIGDAELEPFLKRIDAIPDKASLMKRIHELAHLQGRSRVKRWIKRSLREGSFSSVRKTDAYRAVIRQGSTIDLEKVMARHAENVAAGKNLYKIQGKTQLSRVEDFCVKSYRKPLPLAVPYAVRSWKGLLTLQFNSVETAAPEALVILKDRRSLLVTKALEEPDLDQFIHNHYDTMPETARLAMARAFGLFVARLHARGIYHADLKACNFKKASNPEGFLLLDTDRVEQLQALSRERRVRNLIQINTSIPVRVSRDIRMAFLKAYCSVCPDDAKDLFRRVWSLSENSEVVYRTGSGDRIEHWPKVYKMES